jgi:serine/threonine-protein kinase
LYRRAIGQAEHALAVNPKDAGARSKLALFCAFAGESARARAETEKALALAPASPPILLDATLVFVQIGNQDRAMELLASALTAGTSRTDIESHPDLESLRRDGRFDALLQRQSGHAKSSH